MSAEEAVQAHVEALRHEEEGPLDTGTEALAEVALKLARLLDGGEPVMMTASWARELRSTLQAMSREGAGDGDDDGSWLDRIGVPPAVRDPEEP